MPTKLLVVLVMNDLHLPFKNQIHKYDYCRSDILFDSLKQIFDGQQKSLVDPIRFFD